VVSDIVAVLRIVPVGDKVALMETTLKALSASLTPRKVFEGGEARRKLARRASLRTCAVQSIFFIAPLKCRPRTRCSLPMAIPPQDRKDCHVGGNAFVSFVGFEPGTLCHLCSQEAMKFSPLRCGSLFACLRGTLEEWKHSSKGCEHRVCMVDWVARVHSVCFSRPRRSFQLEMHPRFLSVRFKQLPECTGGPTFHVGFPHQAAAG
jgi:hypothetical protein